jgi:purine nucleosidase
MLANAQLKNVIIDADTDNEIDDLLAIAAAFKSQKLEIIGLTAAQWDGRNQQLEEARDGKWKEKTAYTSLLLNQKLAQLLGRENIPVLVGSERKVVYRKGNPANKPRPNEASNFIIEQALKLPKNKKLTIISLGALTNIASAIMLKPEIAPKISLYWLGQTYDFDKNLWHGEGEFNVANDLDAFDVLCDAKDLEFHIIPNNVSGLLRMHNGNSIAKLKDKPDVAGFIGERWKKWIGNDLEKSWVMWDVALIYAITNPEWAEQVLVETPPGRLQRQVYVYKHIDYEKMDEAFWNAILSPEKMSKVSKKN